MTVRYPKIRVQLTGEDGNAMFIISRARAAARRAGVAQAEIDAFTEAAMSGNYDNVLQTCMKWFNCQ